MALTRKVVLLFLSLAILTLAFGVLLVVLHPRVVRYQLASDLVLSEGSTAVDLWTKRPEFPVYYDISFFNYSSDFSNHTLTPPYRFSVSREKENITFEGVDQVVYVERRSFSFLPDGE